MPKTKERRKPVRTTDPDGTPVVLVPIKHSDLCATVNEEDFDRMMEAGFSDQWWFEETYPGCKYVRVTDPSLASNNLTISRLVVEAGARQIVKYRDGDRLNLRRENLYTLVGHAKRPASTNDLTVSTKQ